MSDEANTSPPPPKEEGDNKEATSASEENGIANVLGSNIGAFGSNLRSSLDDITGKKAADENAKALEEQVSSLTATNTDLSAQNTDLSNKNAVLTNEKEQLAGEKQQLEGEKEQLAGEKEQLITEKEQLTTEKERLEGEVSQLSSEKHDLSSRNSELETTVTTLNEKVTTLSTEVEGLNGKVDSLKHENAALKSQNTELETNLADEDLVSARSTAKSVAIKLKKANTALLHLSKENQNLKAEGEKMKAKITSLETTISDLTAARTDLETQIEGLNASLQDSNKEKEVMVDDLNSSHQEKIKQLERQHSTVLEEVNQSSRNLISTQDRLMNALQGVVAERIEYVGTSVARSIFRKVEVRRNGEKENIIKLKMSGLEDMKAGFEEEIRELKETAINAQQDLMEEIGRATVAIINLNNERKAHRVAQEELEDTTKYLHHYYGSLCSDLDDDLQEALAELSYVREERDRLSERVDDLESEVFDLETDLEHAWELGGRKLLREGEGAMLAMPYQRTSHSGAGGHVSSRKLMSHILDLEEELFETQGKLTVATIHLNAERRDVSLMREELQDTVTEMEAWYSIQYDYLRDKVLTMEEERDELIEAQKEEYEAKLMMKDSEIFALEDELIMLGVAKEDADLEREQLANEAEMSQRMADSLRIEMEADLEDPFSLNVSHRRQLARALDMITQLRMELFKVRSDANTFMREASKSMNESVNSAMNMALAVSGSVIDKEREIYIEKVKRDGDDKVRTVAVLETTIERLKEALHDQMTTVGTLTEENNRLLAEVEENETDIERLEQALADLAYLAETAHNEKQEAKNQVAEKLRHIRDLNEEIEEHNEKAAEAAKQLAANVAEKNELTFLVGILQEQIASAELQAAKAIAEAEAAAAEAHLAKQELRQFRVQIEQLESEADQFRELEQKLRQDKLVLKKTLTVTRKELDDTRATVAKFSRGRGGGPKKDDVETLTYHTEKLNTQLQQRMGQIQVLEDRVFEKEKEIDSLNKLLKKMKKERVNLTNTLAAAEDSLALYHLKQDYMAQKEKLMVIDMVPEVSEKSKRHSRMGSTTSLRSMAMRA